MKRPSLHFLRKLSFATVPSERLAEYAYALTSLKFPASVVFGEWHQEVDDICDCKIAELRNEMTDRLRRGEDSNLLNHALSVLEDTADLADPKTVWTGNIELPQKSVAELIGMHSLSKHWYDIRRSSKMEVFTRVFQWHIVNELLRRGKSNSLAQIMLLVEYLEADNYAHNLSLPYNIGERVRIFTPSDYASDEDLRNHINSLARKADYVSREELIQIADYIQTEIVEKGDTANHMALINAILCTGMPSSFDYPVIVKAFEKATKSLAKTKGRKDIVLAPYFYSLWGLTLKPTYLSRFEKTVRQCYLSLANDRHYPDLGINKEDSDSLESALRFLNEYRMNVWIINDKYDVDKVIAKYKTA